MEFQGGQGKARIREKRPKRAIEELGGATPRSLEALLGLFPIILAFAWPPWNSLKPPQGPVSHVRSYETSDTNLQGLRSLVGP